ncbi:Rib/alpha-like domain-containing protein, partial [Peptoniphilus harei]|uniref:Rib/alpha-like domain-containing protein n=1 Tax=Peptoniphilus harei TaxID=54005 RepID=UPI00254A6058
MDNKKKKKFNTNRVAAYALSGVMLASVIPYNVFANEKVLNDNIQSVSGLEKSPEKPNIAVRDAAAPEDTATDADAKDAVHGFVGVLVGGDINADLKSETGQRFKPIEGVKVYFQWYEAKGNRTSPTYFATSGADGQFHIKAKPYIGRDGKLIKFDADTTVSAGSESYKMWVDESTIPEGYQLQYSTGEGVEFTDRRVAGGGYNLGPNTLVNYRVLLMEKQNEEKMHKEATPTSPQIYSTFPGQGAVRGKVSWDYESAGGVQWGIVSTPTSPADGITVTASYLSDYALKKIYSADTANMLGLSKPSDIRGSGWTFKNETQLQEWIAEQVAADKDNWIAETVSAKTNAEGDYKIQFKGTWGPERNDSSVANSERVAGKFYAKDAHKWTQEEVDRLGTVAEHADEGSFLTGALNHNEKHVNTDWLFISTKDTDDVVKRTPWNYNWYTGSNNAWGIHGGWAQAVFGVSTVQAANSTRADFNLAPAEIKFNITNFDTQKNTATPGDVAVTNTAGLPYKNTNDSFKIVWYDQDGKKIKEEPTQKPTSTGALKEATLDTKDVKETKTFIAKLHYVDSKGRLGQVLAQDAFTVKVNDKIGSRYEDVEFSNGETENATYKASGLPNGLKIDKATGKVTGKPTEAGKFTVTTTVTVAADDAEAEDVSVDKTDEYIITDSPLKAGEVGSEYKTTILPTPINGYAFENVSAKFIDGKEIDGLTIDGDKISGTPTTKVDATQEDPNVQVTYDVYQLREDGTKFLVKKGHVDNVPLSIKDGEATKYEPAYKEVEGKVGEEATVAAPTFTDKDGKAATPENVTYELGEGAPEGAKVNADGSVTYTPVEGEEGTTVNVPVVVKYSDGTEDKVNAPIKVAEKDTAKPEIGDLDDDDNPDTPVAPKEDENNKGPQVWANGARVTEGKEITPIKVNVKDDKDKNPTVEVTGLPKGLSYNKETGKIEGTPDKLTDWAKTEEERDFTATITAKDAAGNEATKEIQITVLRDTDGDGIPDTTDPDDDNDGIKDEEDQNPKAWDAKVEGKVETPVGTQPTVDQYKEKITNLPEGSKVVVKTEPDVSKAGDTTAVVTVTLPNGEEVDVTVPVTVTDTTPGKDTTKPEIGDLDDDDDPTTPVAPKEDENNKGPQVWANGARVTEG